MSELYIHIGSHKTGTTSVQQACRLALKCEGALAAHYFNVRPSGTRITKSSGQAKNFRCAIDLHAADLVFRPEVSKANRGRYVTSEEELFWISEPETVHKLADILRDRFGAVRILCYLRRQDSLAVSHRKQVIEQTLATRFYGVTATPLPVYRPYFQGYFDYAAKLADIWCSAFGKESVTVLPYDGKNLLGGDIVEDFARQTGVEFRTLKVRATNASLAGNQTYIGLKLAENKVEPAVRREIVKNLPPRGAFLPTRTEAREFLANFEQANARLARDWTWNGKPFAFDERFDMYPKSRTPFTTIDAEVDILPRDALRSVVRPSKPATARRSNFNPSADLLDKEKTTMPERLFAYPNLKGSLFVVTYGRSGSTLLQSLLQSIPGAHVSGENFGVLDKLYRASVSAHRTRTTWGKKDRASNDPWFGASKVDPARFERRLVELFVEEIIKPPVQARWIGFKEIRYPALGDDFADFLTFVRRNFPNAHFVFNSRNAEDVGKSKWWAKKPKDQVVSMVKRMDSRFAEYAKANPNHSKHVYYEEAVSDPATLKPVFEMLGEDLDLNLAQSILSVRLTH